MVYLPQNGQADVTQIDGIIGSKSENAISIAQSRLGLPATGIVTEVDREVFKKYVKQKVRYLKRISGLFLTIFKIVFKR